jgi:hypothetical protein
VLFDAHKAFQLLLAELYEQQKEFDKRRNAKKEFVILEDALWNTVNQHFVKRNLTEGNNLRFVGNYCIVTLFQFWEENIRLRIAQVFGVELIEITHPLFGDIRNFRNAIIHNHGIATTDVERNKVFNWYSRGELINMDKEKYFEIIHAVFGIILDHQLVPDVANDVAMFLRQYDI